MPAAYRLKLRLFMEGIEVPIISAAVNIGPNAPSQCQIQIPATDKSFEFLPRTLVHVFFYDFWGDSTNRSIRTNTSPNVPQVETLEDQLSRRNEELGRIREEQIRLQRAMDGLSSYTPYGTSVDEFIRNSALLEATEGVVPEALPNSETIAAARREDLGERYYEMHNNYMERLLEEDSKWKMLFVGEVIGYSFSKTLGSRSIVLDCLDPSIYWDTCYQYKVNVSSLTGDGMAAFVGAGTTFMDVFFSDSMSTVASTLLKGSVTQPELTGLLAGVVRLLESVGGVYVGNEGRDLYGLNPNNIRNRFKGCNDFFSIAELRLKLVYMITAAERDETSRRHFAAQAFNIWGNRRVGQLGQISSFREILNSVNQLIHHTVFPCPVAKFIRRSERLQNRRTTVNRSYATTTEGREAGVRFSTLVTNCQEVENDARSGNLNHINKPANKPAFVSKVNGVKTLATSLGRTASGLGHSSLIDYLNEIVIVANRIIGTNTYTVLTTESAAEMRNYAQLCLTYFRDVTVSETRNQERTVQRHERLNSQIIRPDIFMVAPPRCNVIFPDLASSISFNRQYMREVTRMRMKVSDMVFGANALLDQVYYAPDLEVMGAFAQPNRRRTNRANQQLRGRNLSRAAYAKRLMEHELFTGIVPVFERMDEIAVYGARTEQTNYRGAQIPYAIRAINHQFFKQRWVTRQMSVMGQFNPFVTAGFPAVVLDRYMTRDQLERTASSLLYADQLASDGYSTNPQDNAMRAPGGSTGVSDVTIESDLLGGSPNSVWRVLKEHTPNQFVGLVESVQHSVTQGNAQTSVMLSHSRIHRETEELLGANNVQIDNRSLIRNNNPPRNNRGTPRRGSEGGRPVDNRAVRVTHVAALSQPRIGDVGPYSGEVIRVAPSTRRGELPLYGPHFGDRPTRTWARVPIGVTRRAVDYNAEVVGIVGNENEQVSFSAYEVTEAIDRYRGQTVQVPLEEFIRPPWMSDVWRNDRIGAVYNQFFGTGAITDAMILDSTQSLGNGINADPLSSYLRSAADNQIVGGNPLAEENVTNQTPGVEITVERAIDLLTRAYSQLRHEGLDVADFVKTYCWRPVATLPDILGSRDLTMTEDGRVTAGTEGFHSRAFGHNELGRNLRNLTDEETRRILDFNAAEDRGNILERMDKRADKADRVFAYVRELWESKGLLG